MNIDELKTPEDLALEWGISSRRVEILCKEGRIEGAVKKGHQWLIPENAKRPARRKSGPKN
ncbi:MAG: DNA-binding protein [Parasporobacterium sp.]|nr:DNA-binding protein [Parasporobacterium sp.]